MRTRLILVLSVVAAVAGCGSDTAAESANDGEIVAQIASYEPVVGREQRLLVGLTPQGGGLVGFGTVEFDLAYAGMRTDTVEGTISQTLTATYHLVAGLDAPTDPTGPRRIESSDGLGVYGTNTTFDQAGFWIVRVRGALTDGTKIETSATFEVFSEPKNPFPGEPAPRTVNRLPDDPGVAIRAIDSRADANGVIPDPELHDTTIAASIAAGRPLLIVVSTPTYCISRFCGPITETAEKLSAENPALDVVHLEVWNNFENTAINKEVVDWIYRNGADPREPWVYVVDRQGLISSRFDNVVTNDELRDAITKVLA